MLQHFFSIKHVTLKKYMLFNVVKKHTFFKQLLIKLMIMNLSITFE